MTADKSCYVVSLDTYVQCIVTRTKYCLLIKKKKLDFRYKSVEVKYYKITLK